MSKEKKNAPISDYNLITVTPTQLVDHMKMSIRQGQNLAVFGLRGSGKTEIAVQCIKDLGFHKQYLNLSVLERVDLGGYPDMLSEKKSDFVSYRLPQYFEVLSKEPDEKLGATGVLILDEIDKADPSVEAPLLEIVQFRTINGRPLPNLRAVIMTGNLISEGSKRPSVPLLDRSEAYMIRPDFKSFQEWASQNNMHPAVMAFLKEHERFLFGEAADDDRYKDASPRSWTNASRCLTMAEADKKARFAPKEQEVDVVETKGKGRTRRPVVATFSDSEKELLKSKVSGYLGKHIGAQFNLYFDYYADLLPFADEICDGESTKQEIATKYAELAKNSGRNRQVVLSMIIGNRVSQILDTEKATQNKNKVNVYSPKVEQRLQRMADFFDIIEMEDVILVFRSVISHERITKYLDNTPHMGKIIDKVIAFQQSAKR